VSDGAECRDRTLAAGELAEYAFVSDCSLGGAGCSSVAGESSACRQGAQSQFAKAPLTPHKDSSSFDRQKRSTLLNELNTPDSVITQLN
jgi:hypothetical protein